MNENTLGTQRLFGTSGRAAPSLRPVDGFVVGGEVVWGSGRNMWLLLSRPGERLIDFFLEDDPEDGCSDDPVPCACAGIAPDGSVLIGEVDWEADRFLSEMLDEQESLR
jgi:hypothetical protein